MIDDIGTRMKEMKNLIAIFIIAILFVSCGRAKIDNAVIVEQINILDKDNYKYEVKLKTRNGNNDAFYYTNFRFQVGDTLLSCFEYLEKIKISKDVGASKILYLSQENDSLKKELSASNYYLQLLKEKITIETKK